MKGSVWLDGGSWRISKKTWNLRLGGGLVLIVGPKPFEERDGSHRTGEAGREPPHLHVALTSLAFCRQAQNFIRDIDGTSPILDFGFLFYPLPIFRIN